MLSDEKLHIGPDNIRPLSDGEIKKLNKDKAKRIREQLGISKDVSDDQIVAMESKISEGIKEGVKDTETEIDIAEGNVAEALVKAAEKDNAGDISSALSTARAYHAKSDPYVKKKLQAKKQALVEKLFGEHEKTA